MRDRAAITTCAIAALLAACALDVSPTRAAQAPLVVAQAAADDDGGSPAEGQAPMAPEPGAEPVEPAAAEPAEAPRSSEYGASRTLDPFEDDDELFVPAETIAPSGLGPGIVVCVAGCDAPRDAAVRGTSKIR
jgi:hypothetical protein